MKFIKLILSLLIIYSSVSAQEYKGNEALSRIPNSEFIYVNPKQKIISDVRFNKENSVKIGSAPEIVTKYLMEGKGRIEIDTNRVYTDKVGMTHYRCRQYFGSFPVEYSMILLHSKQEKLVSLNGTYFNNIKVDTLSKISDVEAVEIAKNAYGIKDDGPKPEVRNELVILPLEDSTFKLAYKVRLIMEFEIVPYEVFIDAVEGKFLFQIDKRKYLNVNSKLHTRNYGQQFVSTERIDSGGYKLSGIVSGTNLLFETVRIGSPVLAGPPYRSEFLNNDSIWAYGYDHAALDAHFGLEKTLTFFKDNFSYYSFDNNSAPIRIYIPYSSNYNSTYWTGGGILLGDGSQFHAKTSLEIIGHEFAHGIVENTSKLSYWNWFTGSFVEESFCDIMGIMVRHKYDPRFDWRIGDLVNGNNELRNLRSPIFCSQPSTVGGYWYVSETEGSSAGIINHWFYLLSNGQTGINDVGTPYNVDRIGIQKAGDIIFRCVTNYLTPLAGFYETRFYSIQSAIDLYGECSDEVRAVTDAWHAVGVGDKYTDAVVANFDSDIHSTCSFPATISFQNQSRFATNYHWDFGDGITSNLNNPVHTYGAPGSYDVKLIATGSSFCNTEDTVVLNIKVGNFTTTLAASCIPGSLFPSGDRGIFNFQLENIDKTSGSALDGYQDFSCSEVAFLTAGEFYKFTISTSPLYSESVKIWLDSNNDGALDDSLETVYSSNDNLNGGITGVLRTAGTSAVGVPLRLRVATGSQLPCDDSFKGQIEDYAVVFSPVNSSPIANFTSDDTLVSTGGVVMFADSSIHGATSWNWDFPGGNPSTSSGRDPIVQYSTPGKYDVRLIVQNAFGVDTILKTAYINVMNYYTLCSAVTSATDSEGRIFDSGGPNSNYNENESCTFLINPPCAGPITLNFEYFRYADNIGDYLSIYDGTSDADVLIGTFRKSEFPGQLVANSGSVFLKHQTEVPFSSIGFDLRWSTAIKPLVAPIASFSVSDTTPPLNSYVSFTNLTPGGNGSVKWNFGDGNVSTEGSPNHKYNQPGIYSVQLTSYGCTDSSVFTRQIIVQDAPSIQLSDDTLNISLSCNDTGSVSLGIFNSGAGELVYKVCDSQTKLNILFIVRLPITNDPPNVLKQVLNQSQIEYIFTQVSDTSVTEIQSALEGKDLVFFYSEGIMDSLKFQQIGTLLDDFIRNGGTVALLGRHDDDNQFNYLNLFDVSNPFGNIAGNFYVNSHPLTEGMAPYLIYNSYGHCRPVLISNSDRVPLLYDPVQFFETLSFRHIGRGSAIYSSLDLDNAVAIGERALRNILAFSNSKTPDLSFLPGEYTLAAGANASISFQVNSGQLVAGEYYEDVLICSNDPNSPSSKCVIKITVSGAPSLATSDSCLNFNSIYLSDTSSLGLKIFNTGCDTLRLDSIFVHTGFFSVSTYPDFIYPGDSTALLVQCHPNNTGILVDSLEIISQLGTRYICLNAVSMPTSILQVNSDTLIGNISFCEDSAYFDLYVNNIGGAPLNYCAGTLSSTGPLNVLILKVNSDSSWVVSLTKSAIQLGVPNAIIDSITAPTPLSLDSALANIDVFVIPELFTRDTNLLSSYGPVLQNYLANNGWVVINGTQESGLRSAFATGVFEGGYVGILENYDYVLVEQKTPIAPLNPQTYYIQRVSYIADISNADKEILVSSHGHDIITTRDIGCGKAIYYGHSIKSGNQMNWYFSNIFKWKAGTKNQSFLQLINNSGTIPPGDSTNLQIKYNRDTLTPGTYYLDITINNDQPNSDDLVVPLKLNVLTDSCYSLQYVSDSCGFLVMFDAPKYLGNATYNWDFGDGTSSTLEDPIHGYAQAGIYNVRLILCVDSYCDTINTLVTLIGFPPPSQTCPVVTQNYCCNIGILNVSFAGLNKSTGDASEGCLDLTCQDSVMVSSSQTYALTVTTNSVFPENVAVWIDFDNSGSFDLSEKVLNSQNTVQTHSTLVSIPVTAVPNVPLRMRVRDDVSATTITTPCTNPNRGQAEDYTVIIDALQNVIEPSSISELFIQPNPFVTTTTLSFSLLKEEDVEVIVHDITGRVIHVPHPYDRMIAGLHTFELHTDEEGVYLVSIKTETEVKVLRIIKVK